MDNNRFALDFNGGIVDNLTGLHYSNRIEYCRLLNQVNDRADKDAEKLCEFNKLLRKYEIDDVEKLDRILFEERRW